PSAHHLRLGPALGRLPCSPVELSLPDPRAARQVSAHRGELDARRHLGWTQSADRLAGATRISLQARIASLPLQSSLMSKTYLKSDHFNGGGSVSLRCSWQRGQRTLIHFAGEGLQGKICHVGMGLVWLARAKM